MPMNQGFPAHRIRLVFCIGSEGAATAIWPGTSAGSQIAVPSRLDERKPASWSGRCRGGRGDRPGTSRAGKNPSGREPIKLAGAYKTKIGNCLILWTCLRHGRPGVPIEVKREYSGHQISVRIASLDDPSSKLYIDEKVVDTSKNQMGRGTLLRGAITDDRKTHIVEIKRPFVFITPAILVDGKKI
jgi:hypothetical protein